MNSPMDNAPSSAQIAALIRARMAAEAAAKAAADQETNDDLLIAQYTAGKLGYTLIPATSTAPAADPATPAAPVADPAAPINPVAPVAPVAAGTPTAVQNVFAPGLAAGDDLFWWPIDVAAEDALNVNQADPTKWHRVPKIVHDINMRKLYDKHNEGGVSRLTRFMQLNGKL